MTQRASDLLAELADRLSDNATESGMVAAEAVTAIEPDLLKGNAGTRQDRPNQVRYAFNRRPPAHKGEHRTTSGAFEVLGAREVNELADVEEAGTWLKRR